MKTFRNNIRRMCQLKFRTLSMNLILMAAFVIFSAGLFAPQIVHAQGAMGCNATYVVQRGDYLYAIARKLNISIWDLLRLNPQLRYNPNFIYPGQVLCVPVPTSAPPPTFTAPSQTPDLTLSADVIFSRTRDSGEPHFGGGQASSNQEIGKRVVYPIAANGIEKPILDPAEMPAVLGRTPAPALLLVTSQSTPNVYEFVSVGAQNKSLLDQLNPNQNVPITINHSPGNICAATSLADAFGRPSQMNLVMEDKNHILQLFSIVGLNSLDDASQASQCYGTDGQTVSALFRDGTAAGEFHIVNLFSTQDGGPLTGDGCGYASFFGYTVYFPC